jgi:5-methylcytosine-specific restriction endonuclease McrA
MTDARVNRNGRCWRARNPERARARDKKYRERYREKRQAQYRAWYERNKQSVMLRIEAARRANPELARAKRREQYAVDPTAAKNQQNRRRALLLGSEASLTKQEWHTILARFSYRCAYCGSSDQLTQDHVRPLSRGGAHSKENVVPACKPCNCKKQARLPEEAGMKFIGEGVQITSS